MPFVIWMFDSICFHLTTSWNEWVNLPHLFSELPRTAMLAITILDCAGAGETMVIGGTTISLFGKNGTFRQGMFDLRVWVGVEADGNMDTATPGKGKDSSKHQMQRLAKLAKKHRNGQIPKVDWLDRLTFREIEWINEKEKTESDYLYLLIEFPTICCEQTNQTVSHPIDSFVNIWQLLTVPLLFRFSIQLFISSPMAIQSIHSIRNRSWSPYPIRKSYRWFLLLQFVRSHMMVERQLLWAASITHIQFEYKNKWICVVEAIEPFAFDANKTKSIVVSSFV